MKNHRCQHTLCEQKCGKVVKRNDSRKDLSESVSESKD